MEELLTISYRSFARLRDPVDQISSILAESQDRNQQLGLTGLLLFDGTYFMQTIEGPPNETGTVFVQIVSDRRHADVVPFGIATISERCFPDWRMKLIGPAATARIVPDMDEFDFSDKRLSEVHAAAKDVAMRRRDYHLRMH